MVFKLSKPNTDEHYMEEHVHSAQEVAPSAAAHIALTSGGGAWTLGNFSNDIIANGAVTGPFDVHWIVISNVGANGWYEIVLYYGSTDIECARIAFARTAVFDSSITVPVQMIILPAGSRVRAKMMDDTGGGTAEIKVFFHRYL